MKKPTTPGREEAPHRQGPHDDQCEFRRVQTNRCGCYQRRMETSTHTAPPVALDRLVRQFDLPCLLPPRKLKLWGQESDEQIAFCKSICGNGKLLLAVQPLATRPTYYLIRVDDQWAVSSYDDGETVSGHMEEIYEAIEDDFGQLELEGNDGKMIEQPWPALDTSYGSSWWEADPEDYLPHAIGHPPGEKGNDHE